MTRTMKVTMALASVAVLAGATQASARQFPAPMTYEDPSPNADRARELKSQAEELYSQPKQWRKAARLLEQSAQLREAADPEVYSCLMFAGRIRAAVGELTASRLDLEKAAANALARGAVVEAAHAYIDAAHVAKQEKEIALAKDLVARAKLLTESPLLSGEQKEILQVRLRP